MNLSYTKTVKYKNNIILQLKKYYRDTYSLDIYVRIIPGSTIIQIFPIEIVDALEPGMSDKMNFSTYKLNTKQLRDRLDKILDRQLGINVVQEKNLFFSEEGNKFIIHISDINYNSLSDEKKKNIEAILKNEIHKFLHIRYKKTQDKENLVDMSRINIVAFNGSTYIVIQILPKKLKFELSNEEKDMLEFYNFMGVLNQRRVPIKESDYLQHHYSL